jgi:DNA-directed RNA polymerase I, II, and III subunit RPABC2
MSSKGNKKVRKNKVQQVAKVQQQVNKQETEKKHHIAERKHKQNGNFDDMQKPYYGITYHVYNSLSPTFPTEIKYKIVNPEDRITSNIMMLYEYTEILSIRSTQIQNGQQVYTNVDGLDDPVKMAEKEITDKRCPLSVRRYINNYEVEDWEVNEMTKPAF